MNIGIIETGNIGGTHSRRFDSTGPQGVRREFWRTRNADRERMKVRTENHEYKVKENQKGRTYEQNYRGN